MQVCPELLSRAWRAPLHVLVLASLSGMGAGVLYGCGDVRPQPDSGVALCTLNAACDDRLFCNGEETCSPSASGADARGCVAGSPPCDDLTCDEGRRVCVDCNAADEDNDGHVAVVCGGDDCDDGDANRFPGNLEVCDLEAHDEDCDVSTLGDRDADGDGAVDATCCNPDASGGLRCGTDCNDLVRSVGPHASEVCDTFDNDCDGNVDEGVDVAGFLDRDRDLSGDGIAEVRACYGAARFALVAGDCDDRDPARSPRTQETCDSVDNDCDTRVDESAAAVAWYTDADQDAYGDPHSSPQLSCAPPTTSSSFVAQDCDDADGAVNPLADELCNALDDDCDARTHFQIGPGDYEDDDQDGFADSACGGDAGDCNDRDPFTYPGAVDYVDGRDNDCDGAIDEDEGAARAFYEDLDSDGYGDVTQRMNAVTAPAGYVPLAGDCAPTDSLVFPGAVEVCNGVDDNCDARIDENEVCGVVGVFHTQGGTLELEGDFGEIGRLSIVGGAFSTPTVVRFAKLPIDASPELPTGVAADGTRWVVQIDGEALVPLTLSVPFVGSPLTPTLLTLDSPQDPLYSTVPGAPFDASGLSLMLSESGVWLITDWQGDTGVAAMAGNEEAWGNTWSYGTLDANVDEDEITPTFSGSGATSQGGSVEVFADGSYRYLSPAGFVGDDTFVFTASAFGGSTQAMQTVTVNERAWYVDGGAAVSGDGRVESPFRTLAEAEAAADEDDLLLVQGSLTLPNFATLTLRDGQVLDGGRSESDYGRGVTFGGAAAADITNARIAVNERNVLRGFDARVQGAQTLIHSADALRSELRLEGLNLRGDAMNTGSALDLNNGSVEAGSLVIRECRITGVGSNVLSVRGALQSVVIDDHRPSDPVTRIEGGSVSLQLGGGASTAETPVDIHVQRIDIDGAFRLNGASGTFAVSEAFEAEQDVRIEPSTLSPLRVDITDLRVTHSGLSAFSDGSSGTAAPGTLYTLRGVDLLASALSGTGCGALHIARARVEILPGVDITSNRVSSTGTGNAVCITSQASIGPAGVHLDRVESGSVQNSIFLAPTAVPGAGEFVLAGDGSPGSAGTLGARVQLNDPGRVTLRDLEIRVASGNAISMDIDQDGEHRVEVSNPSGDLFYTLNAHGGAASASAFVLNDVRGGQALRLTVSASDAAQTVIALDDVDARCDNSSTLLVLNASGLAAVDVILEAVSAGTCNTFTPFELNAREDTGLCFSSVDSSFATEGNLRLRTTQNAVIRVEQLMSSSTSSAALRGALESSGNTFGANDDVLLDLAMGSATPGVCQRPTP